MIDNVGSPLSQAFAKKIHFLLTYGTYADRKEKIQSGEYRTSTSAMGIPHREINDSLAELIKNYEKQPANLERILEFHSCRHTYVSQMQALGVDIQTIKSIVGHADVNMTEHYLHVQQSIRQEAVRKFSEAFPQEDGGSNEPGPGKSNILQFPNVG